MAKDPIFRTIRALNHVMRELDRLPADLTDEIGHELYNFTAASTELLHGLAVALGVPSNELPTYPHTSSQTAPAGE